MAEIEWLQIAQIEWLKLKSLEVFGAPLFSASYVCSLGIICLKLIVLRAALFSPINCIKIAYAHLDQTLVERLAAVQLCCKLHRTH